ncbi:MAG: tRNA guanosine(34) transglycosylase Tgt [Acidobacteria bacterium]|nr:MAG: tRNA guanosine(34) transglycosylase Tgt [Acidobacteriota bacterium]
MKEGFSFQVHAGGDTGARTATLVTPRGDLATPAFMPVGTAATVKAVSPAEVRTSGARMILANTYHLMVRPGSQVVRRLGGLHTFSGWDGPILTDSGGFQVFSLAALSKITDQGVVFRSHVDGSLMELTPESSIQAQEDLGSDIMMVLDECTGEPSDRSAAAAAMERSLAWARRSLEARRGGGALFGIIQGGIFPDLRRQSAEATSALALDGFAIGGVSVGEAREHVSAVVEATAPLLPADRPRYLMGMGTPDDLLEMVGHGIDLFDCVMPTRNARNGTLFVRGGRLNLRNSAWREDPRPVEEDCPCPACREYSRAYLRHLLVSREIYGLRLNTLHNLTHYQRLMAGIRQAIGAGSLAAFASAYRAGEPWPR